MVGYRQREVEVGPEGSVNLERVSSRAERGQHEVVAVRSCAMVRRGVGAGRYVLANVLEQVILRQGQLKQWGLGPEIGGKRCAVERHTPSSDQVRDACRIGGLTRRAPRAII